MTPLAQMLIIYTLLVVPIVGTCLLDAYLRRR